MSIDCKATVNIGEYARGGKTRGDNQALDHDMDCTEKYIPFGIVDEDSGQLFITFGSSYKTSDFIVDSIKAYWDSISGEEKNETKKLQFKIDNGPESSGVRRQFLQRMITLADEIKKPIQLLYYPPYHSKYNPIERCWGILEQHWNGSKLLDLKTMLMWASTMTWKGLHPQVTLNSKVYDTLTDLEMELVNNRLERNPSLLKWDIEPDSVPDKLAVVRAAYRYLFNRPNHLDYKNTLDSNLPIGSGEIESAHRYVIQSRLKLAGSWWTIENAKAMLALRVCRANHNWDAYWLKLSSILS